jgi:dTDP-glucose 4,6-dehydratase
VRGLTLLAQSEEHLPVNLGNPREMTLLELADTVIRVTGSKSEIVFAALPIDDPPGAAAGHHPGPPGASLAAEVDLEEGLRRTVNSGLGEGAGLRHPFPAVGR